MLAAVLPTLTSTQIPKLPSNLDWRNPELFKKFRSIRLKDGFLRAPGEEEARRRLEAQGKKYEGSRCHFLFFFCGQAGVEFLREIRLSIIFGDDLSCMDKRNCPDDLKAEDVNIATFMADNKDLYLKYPDGTERMNFIFTKTDLRPFLERYPDLRVKLVANGKAPMRDAYVEGEFTIELVLAD